MTKENKYLKFLIIALAAAIIVPQIALAVWWNPFSWGIWNRVFHFQRTEQKQQQTVCTMDAKQCPDGSYVSRQGPKCEFKACPEVKDETANWKTYTNTQYGFMVSYPKDAGFEINKNDVAKYEILFDANLRITCAKINFQIVGSKYSGISDWLAKSKKSIEEPFEYEGSMMDGKKIESIKDVNIQGVPGKEIVINSKVNAFPLYNVEFGTIKGKNLYTISHGVLDKQQYGDCSSEEIKNSIEVFDKIISTFKFTTSTNQDAKPSITVVSPNGGEVLKINDKYKITWVSNGLSNQKVNITVMEYDQNNKGLGAQWIAFSIPISQGYYYWTPNTEIPSFLSDTNKYKIIIGLNDNLNSDNPISDESNNNFNIVSGAVEINVWPDVNNFDLSNKTFTAKDLDVIADVKIVTNNTTKIYRQVNPIEYHDFQWLYSITKNWVGPTWHFTIKGFMQPDGSILAYEIFYTVQ